MAMAVAKEINVNSISEITYKQGLNDYDYNKFMNYTTRLESTGEYLLADYQSFDKAYSSYDFLSPIISSHYLGNIAVGDMVFEREMIIPRYSGGYDGDYYNIRAIHGGKAIRNNSDGRFHVTLKFEAKASWRSYYETWDVDLSFLVYDYDRITTEADVYVAAPYYFTDPGSGNYYYLRPMSHSELQTNLSFWYQNERDLIWAISSNLPYSGGYTRHAVHCFIYKYNDTYYRIYQDDAHISSSAMEIDTEHWIFPFISEDEYHAAMATYSELPTNLRNWCNMG